MSEEVGDRWQQVYDSRTRLFAEHLGELPPQAVKLVDMSSAWPGGCLFQFQANRLGNKIWAHSTFGLTNPDMPTSVRPENVTQNEATTQLELVSRTPRQVDPSFAGYGYEIIVLTKEPASWPLYLLQWALRAEILEDLNLFGQVAEHGSVTLESLPIAEDKNASFIIERAESIIPKVLELPNGLMNLLVATVITPEEIYFAYERGNSDLSTRLGAASIGQISLLDRESSVSLAELQQPYLEAVLEELMNLISNKLSAATLVLEADHGSQPPTITANIQDESGQPSGININGNLINFATGLFDTSSRFASPWKSFRLAVRLVDEAWKFSFDFAY